MLALQPNIYKTTAVKCCGAECAAVVPITRSHQPELFNPQMVIEWGKRCLQIIPPFLRATATFTLQANAFLPLFNLRHLEKPIIRSAVGIFLDYFSGNLFGFSLIKTWQYGRHEIFHWYKMHLFCSVVMRMSCRHLLHLPLCDVSVQAFLAKPLSCMRAPQSLQHYDLREQLWIKKGRSWDARNLCLLLSTELHPSHNTRSSSSMQEMQPRRLHPLLADAQTTESFCCFFFLCRRKPGIIMLAHKKNVIASLLKVIENLGLLFVCSKKVSERSEKQKANEFLSLAWKPICREPLCSLSQQGHAQVCHQEIKLYCAYPRCQRHCSLSSANARCGIKKTVFCNQDL